MGWKIKPLWRCRLFFHYIFDFPVPRKQERPARQVVALPTGISRALHYSLPGGRLIAETRFPSVPRIGSPLPARPRDVECLPCRGPEMPTGGSFSGSGMTLDSAGVRSGGTQRSSEKQFVPPDKGKGRPIGFEFPWEGLRTSHYLPPLNLVSHPKDLRKAQWPGEAPEHRPTVSLHKW